MELSIMGKFFSKNLEDEYSKITKLVLKGMTIPQIAQEMNYSESTVSNRLNVLFHKYKATTRVEFVYNFLFKIVQNYKADFRTLSEENRKLKRKLKTVKRIIINIEKNYKYSSELLNWINKGKEYLNKITY